MTEDILENGVGSYLQTAAGTSLAITGTTSEGSTDDRYPGRQRLSRGTESMAAANGAIVSTLTVAQQQSHIISSGALDAVSLAATTSVAVSNNSVYVVANDGTTTTVDGKTVALIATGAGGAPIYAIDATLE